MPNRVLRDYTDSAAFERLSAEAERLFVRLVVKADDYGRFHADARLIRAACFPLLDNLRVETVNAWLEELSNARLILLYEVSGKKCLAICNFGQRLKDSRPKFPQPEGEAFDFLLVKEYIRDVPGCSGMLKEDPASRDARARPRPIPNTSPNTSPNTHEREDPGIETDIPPLPRGFPLTEQKAIDAIQGIALADPPPAAFIAEIWNQCAARGGKDGAGMQIFRWPNHVQKRWSSEKMQWNARKRAEAAAPVNGHAVLEVDDSIETLEQVMQRKLAERKSEEEANGW